MIIYKTGNLLRDDAQALINTVNTVGVMGKGIALQFKKAFPRNYLVYKQACDDKTLKIGNVLVVPTANLSGSEFIINFPTKQHWREKSKLVYIQSGLKSLIDEIEKNNIKSVAVPPLGCGNGGLDWSVVKPILISAFNMRPNVEWRIYEPEYQPNTDDILIVNNCPNMTEIRAFMIILMDKYFVCRGVSEITTIEIQKLLYFLNVMGESMNGLKFEKHHYGPYSDQIRHVLNILEGFYISGYGDAHDMGPDVRLKLMPQAAYIASQWLEKNSNALTVARFQYVFKLIESYHTPHELELLSTVHWVVTQEIKNIEESSETVIEYIHNWNRHKQNAMSEADIKKALNDLKSKGWLHKIASV